MTAKVNSGVASTPLNQIATLTLRNYLRGPRKMKFCGERSLQVIVEQGKCFCTVKS